MSQPENSSAPEQEGPSRLGLLVFLAALAVVGACWGLSEALPAPSTRVVFLLAQVVLISMIIWQACDPFAEAAQWIGQQLRIPGSVRGATLDAVASSMPELFSGVFFVLLAIAAAESAGGTAVDAGSEGYGASVATCAGSAIYNMILIPAVCALVIAFSRKSRPTIDIEPEVISRDGLWFIGCEGVLILFLFMDAMHWWMGIVLIALYCVYVGQLSRDARLHRRAWRVIHEHLNEVGPDSPNETIEALLKAEGLPPNPVLLEHLRARLREQQSGDEGAAEEEEVDEVSFLFGLARLPLNKATAAVVILVGTGVAAAACKWLVDVTRASADELNVPIFFIAVVLAAAASSVPDTFLSIGAARRGDDSGAVSNAFGSNIFDICICLAVPLLLNSYLTGWRPVELTQDGQPMAGLVGIRLLLASLTVVTLLIMWHNRQLTRNKALVLCGLYLIFLAYAVAGSLGWLAL